MLASEVVLCDEVPVDGCFGFAGDEVPAVGGYAWLPGLAAVALSEALLVAVLLSGLLAEDEPPDGGYAWLPGVLWMFELSDLAGLPGSCR